MNELYHHGVKGMKWGVRRYQNTDGTLTSKGRKQLSERKKKRLSKKYKKETDQLAESLNRNRDKRVENARSRAAKDYAAKEGKYSENYRKQHGIRRNATKYMMNDDYLSGLDDIWEDSFTRAYNDITYKEITRNKNYQNAKNLVSKYGLTDFDATAKDLESNVEYMRTHS